MADLKIMRPLWQLRYANNSNYKNDTIIRKEAFVSEGVLSELKRMIEDSEARARPRLRSPCKRNPKTRRSAPRR